jgi:hypothetical protein
VGCTADISEILTICFSTVPPPKAGSTSALNHCKSLNQILRYIIHLSEGREYSEHSGLGGLYGIRLENVVNSLQYLYTSG